MAAPTAGTTPPVHQYLWIDHSLPQSRNVVMTIGSTNAIVCFAFIAAAFTYTQARCWVVIRSLGFRLWRPLQLALPPDHPDSKKRFSQVKAIRSLFRRRTPQDDLLSMMRIPKLFGVAAILNAAAFFVMGIFIPLYLTGYLSTAVVQSKFLDTCTGYELRPSVFRYAAQLADSYFKRCLVNAPLPPSCLQESGIVGDMPPLWINRDLPCPFSGGVCQDDVAPVQFEFKGLSPRDFGVNLEKRLLVDHRLTCAPIKIEEFVFTRRDDRGERNRSAVWFGRAPTESLEAIYGAHLETSNGPNRFSDNFSGNYLASISRPQPAYALNFYPEPMSSSTGADFHPNLRREDGSVFLTVLKAGRTYYDEPIDDPFYAAHNKDPIIGEYIPDYEATALGCLEQFRFCLLDDTGFCTGWGNSTQITMQLFTSSTNKISVDLGLDAAFIYIFFTTMASVKRYFGLRTGTQVLMTSLLRQSDTVSFLDPNEQWVAEVKAWFTTAFVSARYGLLQIVTRNDGKRAENAPKSMYKICHLILFQSSDYTNVNFIGLLTTMAALLLICAFSIGNQIAHALKAVCKALNSRLKALLAILERGIQLIASYLVTVWGFCKEMCSAQSPQARNSPGQLFSWRQRIPAYFQSPFWRRGSNHRDFFSGDDGIDLGR